MNNNLAQLADITADWCGMDLERLGHTRPVNAGAIAEEAIRCLLHTVVHDPVAYRLLMNLIREEFIQAHVSRQDLDDAGAI